MTIVSQKVKIKEQKRYKDRQTHSTPTHTHNPARAQPPPPPNARRRPCHTPGKELHRKNLTRTNIRSQTFEEFRREDFLLPLATPLVSSPCPFPLPLSLFPSSSDLLTLHSSSPNFLHPLVNLLYILPTLCLPSFSSNLLSSFVPPFRPSGIPFSFITLR